MIYISAVGMINAPGNNLDEIAANLTRGVAPRNAPTRRLVAGIRRRSGWRGWRASAYPGKIRCAPLAQQSDPAGGAGADPAAQVDDAIAKYGRERIAIVLGTSTSGLHEGDTHVNLRTHGQPSTTWHYAQQGTRRSVAFFSATGWRSTARPILFQPPALPAPER